MHFVHFEMDDDALLCGFRFGCGSAFGFGSGLVDSRALGSLVCRAISKPRTLEPSTNIVRSVGRVESCSSRTARVGCFVWVVGAEEQE